MRKISRVMLLLAGAALVVPALWAAAPLCNPSSAVDAQSCALACVRCGTFSFIWNPSTHSCSCAGIG